PARTGGGPTVRRRPTGARARDRDPHLRRLRDPSQVPRRRCPWNDRGQRIEHSGESDAAAGSTERSEAMADIQGTWEPGFEGVASTLAASLDAGTDVGASVAVFLRGRP